MNCILWVVTSSIERASNFGLRTHSAAHNRILRFYLLKRMQLRITREKREKQKARWIDEKYKEWRNNKNLSFSVKLLKLLVTEKNRKKNFKLIAHRCQKGNSQEARLIHSQSTPLFTSRDDSSAMIHPASFISLYCLSDRHHDSFTESKPALTTTTPHSEPISFHMTSYYAFINYKVSFYIEL